MTRVAGIRRLLNWLRRRQGSAAPDPADVGTAYGMELCLHAHEESARKPAAGQRRADPAAAGTDPRNKSA